MGILLHLFSNTFRLSIKRYFLIFVNQVKVSLGHQNCIEIVDFRVAKLAIQHSYMSAIFPFLCLLCTHNLPIPYPYLTHTLSIPYPYLTHTLPIPYPYLTHTVSIPYPHLTHTLPIPYPYLTHTLPIPCPY